MNFTYAEDRPTIESAIAQGIGLGSTAWSHLNEAGTFQSHIARTAVEASTAETKRIIIENLAKAIDWDGFAVEWNKAIDFAIEAVQKS